MTSYHVVHWIPDPRLHIFNGYNEVIESVIWGLRALGHEATYAVNALRPGATPIVFGAQLMDRAMLAQLPSGAIIYNLEQLHGLRAAGRALDDLAWIGRRAAIWDYSSSNLAIWAELGAVDARHVPVGFAPCLARIPRPDHQDIDVLLYGGPSASRFAVLAELCAHGHAAMFFCGLYSHARDALIGRAKIVLSITSNADSGIFSIVRASYLFANRKAVIADLAEVEEDIVAGVAFAPRHEIAALCGRMLRDEVARVGLQDAGFEAIRGRDIRTILATACHPGTAVAAV